MGKEIRKVPKGWEHPRDKNGKYEPLYDASYTASLEEWFVNHRLWEKGEHPDQKKYQEAKDCKFYAEWADNPPDVTYYPSKWSEEEAVCFQLYETITVGTPLSPVFDTLKELEDWLVNTQVYDRKSAKEFCETGYVLTFGPAQDPWQSPKQASKTATKPAKGKRWKL